MKQHPAGVQIKTRSNYYTCSLETVCSSSECLGLDVLFTIESNLINNSALSQYVHLVLKFFLKHIRSKTFSENCYSVLFIKYSIKVNSNPNQIHSIPNSFQSNPLSLIQSNPNPILSNPKPKIQSKSILDLIQYPTQIQSNQSNPINPIQI